MTYSSLLLKEFHFSELFTTDGLARLDASFLKFLKGADKVLQAKLLH